MKDFIAERREIIYERRGEGKRIGEAKGRIEGNVSIRS